MSLPIVFVVDCSETDYDIFRRVADQNGISLSEWIVRTARQGIPQDQLQKMLTPVPEVVDQAFAKLDEGDQREAGLPPVEPPRPPGQKPRPQPKTTLKSRSPALTENKKADPQFVHPCQHLLKEYRSPHSARTCQGTCAKLDKPCFWAPLASKNCPDFQAKLPNIRRS